ncbi:MAG TPA: hypothetical protein VJ844_00070 [Mucilaginibacter sp.]|nr:hypothetical protein [Mucilaginibacter sp.]
MLTLLQVAGLLAIIIAAIAGPKKNNEIISKTNNDTSNAHYAIDEDGHLVEIHRSELHRHGQ